VATRVTDCSEQRAVTGCKQDSLCFECYPSSFECSLSLKASRCFEGWLLLPLQVTMEEHKVM
jgi:hypothetical protein